MPDLPPFLAEMKRRKVVSTALVYAVVAWGWSRWHRSSCPRSERAAELRERVRATWTEADVPFDAVLDPSVGGPQRAVAAVGR